jgi:hypothetical protein
MKKAIQIYIVAASLCAGVAPGAPAWLKPLNEAGLEAHGFLDYRYGVRLQTDPAEDQRALNELRLQLDNVWYRNRFTAQLKTDLVYDELAADRDSIDLETGRGLLDLRQANVLFSPRSWMDVKIGRQVLTWGCGDLVFINDMFPKDWQSFFLGRDDEYLKAPSDAFFVSLFPGFANIDIAYTPRFDADRHITGERISYWNGRAVVGQNDVLNTDRPDDWFADDELAARLYRNVGAYEVALYGYQGFWKSPGGMDPISGRWLFPELAVYGASTRGPLAGGIFSIEAGYYDSADDRDGDDPFINNSEARLLLGFEREAVKNLTVGVQYYIERMLDHAAYIRALEANAMPTDSARDEDRHTATLRLTWMLMNQNLILSCFTRYSPSDEDVYVKSSATYKVSDTWQASIGGNLFAGAETYTFLGQFEDNSNIYASLRCSY